MVSPSNRAAHSSGMRLLHILQARGVFRRPAKPAHTTQPSARPTGLHICQEKEGRSGHLVVLPTFLHSRRKGTHLGAEVKDVKMWVRWIILSRLPGWHRIDSRTGGEGNGGTRPGHRRLSEGCPLLHDFGTPGSLRHWFLYWPLWVKRASNPSTTLSRGIVGSP